MKELLFLGGVAHGQVHLVSDDAEYFLVPRPVGQGLEMDPSGVPLLSRMAEVRYTRRRFTAPSGRYREVMVDSAMPPAMGLQALADVLVAVWVEAGDLPEPEPEPDDEDMEALRAILKETNARRIDAQDESGRAGGPARPLAGDQ